MPPKKKAAKKTAKKKVVKKTKKTAKKAKPIARTANKPRRAKEPAPAAFKLHGLHERRRPL